MLSERPVHTTLPVSDLDQARRFYEAVLGFVPMRVLSSSVTYEAASGTRFNVFVSAGRSSGTHTQMGFRVPDIESEMDDLRDRGVTFETFDMAGFDPKTSMATTETHRAAWFRDPDGNLLGVVQETDAD